MTATRFHPGGRLSVQALVSATGATVGGGSSEDSWTLCTDSREMRDGAVFVAIRGESFDGHRFVDEVLASWRAGALVEELPSSAATAQGPVLKVDDSLVAFGAAAGAFLQEQAPPVAAVTGSVGKTTTRAMLAAILSEMGPGLCTEGNFNNRVGLPLTLLGLRPEHGWVVLEMGMSEPGEIRALTSIADPKVRVITTVNAGHLAFFDSVEGIADAKGELFEAAGSGNTLIQPAGEWFSDRLPSPRGAEKVTFSSRPGVAADLFLLEWTPRGLSGSTARVSLAGTECVLELPVAGRHQVDNALAAAGAALAMGASVSQVTEGLAGVQIPGRRMRVEQVGAFTVVDDAYNANPASVEAALQTLGSLAGEGRRVAVLGDMLELGGSGADLHAEAGRQAAAQGIDFLVGSGPLMAHAVSAARSQGVEAVAVSDSVAAGLLLKEYLEPGDTVLFKGSRGMQMERALEAIRPPSPHEKAES
ncbi:MAG: UDP-N-acetylmuramoyl-tripeptide--D-alanyl-D-alanine ligase [Myxococcota bacterium]|nr:UDP-N-acetylmuramoyl-tripeptide--D-alanyl-D-alanine ligase [Myxococcota bacterium]